MNWDDKSNDYEHALAEIERLRAALIEARKVTLETADATGMHRPALICQIDAALGVDEQKGNGDD
jgi:hypothetical protein